MRRYLNEDSLQLQLDRSFPQVVDEIYVRRGDTAALEIGFVRADSSVSGQTVDKGTLNMRLDAKPATGDQRFDGPAVLLADDFTRVVSGELVHYRGLVPISSGLLDKLLGVDPTSEKQIVNVTFEADVAGNSNGRYFDLSDASGPVRVYFWVSSLTDTPPSTPSGGRLRKITITSGATASAIATAADTAFDADSGLDISIDGTVATFTDKSVGVRSVPSPGSSGLQIAIVQAGTSALTVTDEENVELEAWISYEDTFGWQTTRAFTIIIENNPRRDTDAAPVDAGGLVRGSAVLRHPDGTVEIFEAGADDDVSRGAALVAARAAASAGDLIDVAPGGYSVTAPLAKDQVNWNFAAGATVIYEDDAESTGIWDDGNTAMVFDVTGSGDFIRQKATVSGGTAWATVSAKHASSVITIEARDITSESEVSENYHGPVYAGGGRLHVRARRLIALGENGGTAYGFWWEGGTAHITADRIESEFMGVYSSVVGTDELHAFVDIQTFAGVRGVWVQNGTNPNAAVWVRAATMHCSGHLVSSNDLNKVYVTAQKVFGPVACNAGAGLVYVTSDKASAVANGDAGTPSLGLVADGELFYTVKHWDRGSFTGDTFNVSGGVTRIFGGQFAAGTAKGFQISGGTARLQGLKIDTSGSATQNPVTKSGGTLILDHCTLVAEGTRDSIEAATSQTVITLGSFANKAVDGNVTVSPASGWIVDAAVA